MDIKVKVNIDWDKIKKKNTENMKKRLDKFSDILIKKIDEKTPEDTKTLIQNNQKSEIIEHNWKLYQKVFNDTEYAIYVEYWVWKIFNYKKNKKIFYTWNWVWMFARSKKELEWKFKKLTD